jgi:hypothetical protein
LGKQQDANMNDTIEQQEKRGVQRFDLKLHTVLKELENRADMLELYTRDISSDGAFLCMENPLPLDTPVELTFFLPLRRQIRSKIQTNGRIIRAEGRGVAVRFESSYQIVAV